MKAASRAGSIRAVTPPRKVARALARTDAAGVLVLRESSQGGRSRYLVDNHDGRAETWSGAVLSLVQIGARVYAPAKDGHCYRATKRGSPLLPNIAGMLLPSGVAGLRYVIGRRSIRWSIKTSGKYQPHGIVRVNAAGRIVSGTVFSGPGVPLTATVSYPSHTPVIRKPTKLC